MECPGLIRQPYTLQMVPLTYVSPAYNRGPPHARDDLLRLTGPYIQRLLLEFALSLSSLYRLASNVYIRLCLPQLLYDQPFNHLLLPSSPFSTASSLGAPYIRPTYYNEGMESRRSLTEASSLGTTYKCQTNNGAKYPGLF